MMFFRGEVAAGAAHAVVRRERWTRSSSLPSKSLSNEKTNNCNDPCYYFPMIMLSSDQHMLESGCCTAVRLVNRRGCRGTGTAAAGVAAVAWHATSAAAAAPGEKRAESCVSQEEKERVQELTY